MRKNQRLAHSDCLYFFFTTMRKKNHRLHIWGDTCVCWEKERKKERERERDNESVDNFNKGPTWHHDAGPSREHIQTYTPCKRSLGICLFSEAVARLSLFEITSGNSPVFLRNSWICWERYRGPCAKSAVAQADVPSSWEESDPKYITNSTEVRLRSFTTKVHKVETTVTYKDQSNDDI